MRAYLPRWPLAVTCPNSMLLPAPASAGDATHDTGSSSGSTPWVAPTPDRPSPDAAPESIPVLPDPHPRSDGARHSGREDR